MKLVMLMFGKSKKRMKPIMIDSQHKCEQYQAQREATKGSKAAAGHHAIVPAEPGATVWRKDQNSKWTGYNESGPKLSR